MSTTKLPESQCVGYLVPTSHEFNFIQFNAIQLYVFIILKTTVVVEG